MGRGTADPVDAGPRDGDGSRFDAIVIGGGSGGLAFAKRAASEGARVAIIEKDALGGTCVNRGCVPKKLLWHVAHARREEDALVESGHLVSPPLLDFAHVRDRVRAHIETIRESFVGALDEAGAVLFRGRAELGERKGGEWTVRCGPRVLRTGRVVLATGSYPVPPEDDLPGRELIELSDDVFDWREVPERLLIAGGGYIGVEFATIFSGLGTEVTVIDAGDEILEGFDRDAITHVRRHLERDGVTLRTGVTLGGVEEGEEGLVATLDDGSTVTCDHILYAIGREPRLERLGEVVEELERADSGALAVSDDFETSRRGIYAVGDAADRMPLTPVAKRDGQWLADRMFGAGEMTKLDLDLVATVAFTDPPVAQIGAVEAGDGTADGLAVAADTVSPLLNGLMQQSNRPAGEGDHETDFHKLLTDGEGGPLRGIVLVADGAADQIGWAATLIAGGVPVSALSRPAAVHPSFSEEMIGS